MPYKYQDVERKLKKLGYRIMRQKGSHVIFAKGRVVLPVPKHTGRDISPGVESSIIKIIALTKEEFNRL